MHLSRRSDALEHKRKKANMFESFREIFPLSDEGVLHESYFFLSLIKLSLVVVVNFAWHPNKDMIILLC